jgi:hypothetical protein
LHVDVRLGAVAGVPAETKHIADPYALPQTDLHTALLEVAESDHDTRALDQHVITGERHPAPFGSAALRQRVMDGWHAAIGRMVGFGVVCSHNDPLDGCEYRASEARKSLGRFRTEEGAQRERRRAPIVVDWNEIDCV